MKRQVCHRGQAVLTALGYSSASTPTVAAMISIADQVESLPLRAAAVSWDRFPFPAEAMRCFF